VTKENCNSKKDEIGPWSSIYSFGPKATVSSADVVVFLAEGVEPHEGDFPVDDYTPKNGYVVVKRCWELDAQECSKLDKDMIDPKRYPDKFSWKQYCTSESIRFLKKQGVTPPSAKGPIKQGIVTRSAQNPKSLAENLSRNGGMVISGDK
jgi:hypothetical protein